jgi:PAS domain S-box-containing protein
MVPESGARDVSFEAVFDAASVGIALMDRDGRFVRCNAVFCAMLGYGEADLIGHPFTDVTHQGDIDAHAILLGQLLEGTRAAYEMSKRYLHRDGRVVYVHVTATRLPNGVALSIVRDVTSEWASRDQLRRSQEQLGIALASVEMGFWEWDVVADQMLWSEEMARLCGLDVTPVGHRFGAHFDLIHPDDMLMVVRTVHEAITDPARRVLDCEFRVIRPDGNERWFLAKAHVFRNADGDPLRVLGALIDITRRQLLQQQFLHAQKMEAMGRFASGIAHDFNNSLMVIMGHCDVLQMDNPTRDALQQGVIEISRAAERAAHLTRQLLTFSRKGNTEPRRLNPNETLISLEAFMRPLAGPHQLRLQLSPGVGRIRIDERQLEQAIVNLVVNARDAMIETGVITIATDTAPDGRVTIAVKDTGTGFDELTKMRLFEPFFTTKAPGQGTGLGLAVVLAVVEEAKGDVYVESSPGRGALFELRFPAAA